MLVVVFLVAPDGPPGNIIAINRTRDSITISWDAVEDNLKNGVLSGYEIFWKEVASNVNGSIKVGWDDGKRRKKRDTSSAQAMQKSNDITNYPTIHERIYTIPNLTVYTNYSVKIAAYTVALGPYSNETYLMSGEGGR